jgi:VCBS repeat-containing protein
VILGAEGGDQLGFEVRSAGEVNGDGFDDIGIAGGGGDRYVIYGRDTAPDIGGNIAGTAKEAGGVDNGTPGMDATGNLDYTDPCNNEEVWQVVAEPTPGDSGYGSYTLNRDGTWTYVDNGAVLPVSGVGGDAGNVGTQITLAPGALLTLNADGIFAYDPNDQCGDLNPGDTVTDQFSYQVTDENGCTDTATVTVEITGAKFDVDIDRKPGSNPSAMNIEEGGGAVPVANLGSDAFDAREIDLASILADDELDALCDGTGGVGVNVKNNGRYQASVEEVNGDGYLDLALHFAKADLRQVVDQDQEPFLTDNQIYLSGETLDGETFLGTQPADDPIWLI